MQTVVFTFTVKFWYFKHPTSPNCLSERFSNVVTASRHFCVCSWDRTIIIFKALHRLAPVYLSELLTLFSTNRLRCWPITALHFTFPLKVQTWSDIFLCWSQTVDSLPAIIRSSSSIDILKTCLKGIIYNFVELCLCCGCLPEVINWGCIQF